MTYHLVNKHRYGNPPFFYRKIIYMNGSFFNIHVGLPDGRSFMSILNQQKPVRKTNNIQGLKSLGKKNEKSRRKNRVETSLICWIDMSTEASRPVWYSAMAWLLGFWDDLRAGKHLLSDISMVTTWLLPQHLNIIFRQ